MLNRIASWFLATKLWRRVASREIAYFTFRTFGYPKFPMEKYFEIEALLQRTWREVPNVSKKMYAFVCADYDSLSWKLNNKVTGARWGHAGYVYIGADLRPRILHMKGNGLNDWCLLDLLREVDAFALIEVDMPVNDYNVAEKRVDKLKLCHSVAYDYSLELDESLIKWLDPSSMVSTPNTVAWRGNKVLNIYCSEFVYYIFYPLFRARNFRGRQVFEPDDLYRQGKVIFEHDKRHRSCRNG